MLLTDPQSLYQFGGRPPSKTNGDLKHKDGRHEDGVPEVHFLVQSCAERKKLSAISRRPHVDKAIFTVFMLCGQLRFPCQTFSFCTSTYQIFRKHRKESSSWCSVLTYFGRHFKINVVSEGRHLKIFSGTIVPATVARERNKKKSRSLKSFY